MNAGLIEYLVKAGELDHLVRDAPKIPFDAIIASIGASADPTTQGIKGDYGGSGAHLHGAVKPIIDTQSPRLILRTHSFDRFFSLNKTGLREAWKLTRVGEAPVLAMPDVQKPFEIESRRTL